MIEWILVKKKISELKEDPRNPRTLSKKQGKLLQDSLSEYGLADKPIINQDNTIIGGHQRIKILKKMGYKEVECFIPESPLSEEQAKSLNLVLNRVHGDFDYDMLADDWEPEDLINHGFSEQELHLNDEPIEEIEEKQPKEQKKKQVACPSCGYEF